MGKEKKPPTLMLLSCYVKTLEDNDIIYYVSKYKSTPVWHRNEAANETFEKMFQDDSGKVIKGLSLNSTLASGVPGTVSGMFYASEKFGKMDIKSLMRPSINLARDGFVLSDFQAKNLNKHKEKFLKNEEMSSNGQSDAMVFSITFAIKGFNSLSKYS